MSYRYGKSDVEFVISKLDSGIKQKDVNDIYHLQRAKEGTATKKGDYSNFISKLAKGSKHRILTKTKAYEHTESYNILYKIKHCIKGTIKEAKKVLKRNIEPLCEPGFATTQGNLHSIRTKAPTACGEYVYYMYSIVDYDDFSGVKDSGDVWTHKAEADNHTFKDICMGYVGINEIMAALRGKAGGRYEMELLCVCIKG